jgi:hypothetical protein
MGNRYTLDPLLDDSGLDLDQDGLSNIEEFSANTNATLPDIDGDGLSDGDEVNVYLSNPTNRDTDADTIPDGWEVNNGLDHWMQTMQQLIRTVMDWIISPSFS